jgi:DAK2 domain fusion protein YloV
VLDGAAAKLAMLRADDQAWRAVADPVEGTILSVSRAASAAAQRAGDSLSDVVTALVGAAREALAATREQLEALRLAGVVDAGGRGYLVLLEALDDLVHRDGRRPRGRRRGAARLPSPDLAALRGAQDRLTPGGPAYEVMYLLEADESAVQTLRRSLATLGESLVVVGADGLWHVHVHAHDPGAAIEAGLVAGRPHRVRITHLAEQAERAARRDPGPDDAAQVGLVACAAGPGLAELFSGAGARVVTGGPGRRASTAQILEAITATRAGAVVVLPNDSDTLAVAEAAARSARGAGLRVSVLPTRAQVQGLAAAAVHDPDRGVDDDVVRMSAAAGATRDGAVTVAVREAITTGGRCYPGDVLGIVEGDVVLVGAHPEKVGIAVLERLLRGGGELVTLVGGERADDALLAALGEHVRRTHPGVEVSVLDGGQPRYPVLIGVE